MRPPKAAPQAFSDMPVKNVLPRVPFDSILLHIQMKNIYSAEVMG